MKIFKPSFIHFLSVLTLYWACSKKNVAPDAKNYGSASSATGMEYSKSDTTFHPDQANANKPYDPSTYKRPNMRLIEGGRALIGYEEAEFTHSKMQYFTTTVETFYMDETEIANIHWLEYLWHLRKVSEQEYLAALPDTNVWSRQFSFNDFYVENYLRHPAFRFYPVVGVSWLQANEYCKWRTDPQWHKLQFVKKEGTGKKIQLNDTLWVYEGYKTDLPEKQPKPSFRLPTEAEWIYAAVCFSYMVPYIDEKEFYRRKYPWDGNSMRNPYKKGRGNFLANFKRGRGDYGGVAGYRNDGAVYTEYIYAYPPNDVGLYNMAGNVNEWVQELWDHVPLEVDKFEFNGKLNETEEQKLAKEQGTFEEYLEEERYRVYKGGSWNDVAHWLSPFSRRKLAEDSSTSTIGFRCAMSVFPDKD